jgi:hypothetical protein
MNLGGAVFVFGLLAWHIYSDTAIPPAYANCSTLPLYARAGDPWIGDINSLVTDNGWLESILGAVVLTNSSAIKQRLYDPEDGTVQVTLPDSIGQFQTMTFPKKPFPSDGANCGAAGFNSTQSSAWVSAMYDGLKTVFKKDNLSSNAGLGPRISRGLNAIQGSSGWSRNHSCLILPIPGTQSLYELASSAPVVAAMYPNTTQPQYANRMVAITASSSLNSTTNTISFASMSVFGRLGVSYLPWNEWSANCQVMFWT